MTDNMFTPQPFDLGKLYPLGLPEIHPVPATYRAGAAHFARHLLEVAEQLQRRVEREPDADAEIDAMATRLDDAWAALQRTLVHYRTYRDVQGWS